MKHYTKSSFKDGPNDSDIYTRRIDSVDDEVKGSQWYGQISVYGNSKKEAKQLRNQILKALDNEQTVKGAPLMPDSTTGLLERNTELVNQVHALETQLVASELQVADLLDRVKPIFRGLKVPSADHNTTTLYRKQGINKTTSTLPK